MPVRGSVRVDDAGAAGGGGVERPVQGGTARSHPVGPLPTRVHPTRDRVHMYYVGFRNLRQIDFQQGAGSVSGEHTTEGDVAAILSGHDDVRGRPRFGDEQ